MSHFESAKANFLSRIRKVSSNLSSHKSRVRLWVTLPALGGL